MPHKTCDNCGRTLEYAPEQGGSKMRCPDCGDVNVLPASAPQDRAAAAGLPPDSGPEVNVLVLRPSMWRAHPILMVCTLGIATLFLWFSHLGERIYVTNKRTIWRRGFFSKHLSEVLHDHVRNIQVEQSFLNRIFNVGDIGISSAGQDGIEIRAAHIPRPMDVKKTIDHYRPM